MVHSAIEVSANCKMNPSPTSPVSASAFGPYAATHTSSSLRAAHGRRNSEPLYETLRPLASSRMTCTASRKVASVVGAPLVTRTAESPRPIPHTVRLPNISFRVA